MKSLFVILILLCRLTEPFVWDWFCSKLACTLVITNTKDKKKSLLLFILACFGSFLISDFIGELNVLSFLFNNSLIVIFYFYAVRVYHLNFKIVCGCLSIHYIFSCFTEYLLSFLQIIIFNSLRITSFEPSLTRCIMYIIFTVLSFLVFFFLSRLDLHALCALEHDRIFYTLVFVFTLDIFAFCLFSCIPNENIFNIGTFVSLMIEVAVTCHALRMLFLDVNTLRNFETELLCTKNRLEMFQFDADKLEQTSKFMHDVKHHINTISYYLEHDDMKSAKEYISGLTPAMDDLRIEDFGYNRFSNLIHKKVLEAKSHGIDFTFSSELIDLKIPLYELSSVFNNLLDNAIEGCLANTASTYHNISFFIRKMPTEILIIVINDCLPTLDGVPTGTTKDDKENHGFGIGIITDFAYKYSGDSFILAEDSLFMVQISLPLNYGVWEENDSIDTEITDLESSLDLT
ncbi:MAG TPA: hypothetical protein DCW90_06230 [Lachnospiraceae bacterium]|nr:hypothetical protein [Lachnospiraceae bacterium]